MKSTLRSWRKRNHLTQAAASSILGLSQPYLSLLEKGVRPLTPSVRDRMNAMSRPVAGSEITFRAQLSALDYPAFAHIKPSPRKPGPAALLLSILGKPDTDTRIAESLPWLIRRYASTLDFVWLVRQAKLNDLQNRLGFLLESTSVETPAITMALDELRRARLLQEATFCWDSMPQATRDWMRGNRTPLAQSWNILTRMQPQPNVGDVHDAAA